jgi:hypothetical protein
MALGLTLVSLLFVSGCYKSGNPKEVVDQTTFRFLGGTIFTEPDQLTMKEIHLDNGTLLGRDIIVEGVVAEVSKHHTYMVLTDSTARLMVILTGLVEAEPIIENEKPRIVRILGTVESGRKGHPILKAKAINVVKEPTGAAAKTSNQDTPQAG